MTTTAIPHDHALAIVLADPLPAPLPTFSGDQMRQAFMAYQNLQRAIDATMRDQILRLGFGGQHQRLAGRRSRSGVRAHSPRADAGTDADARRRRRDFVLREHPYGPRASRTC